MGGWIQVSTAPQPLLPQEEPWASFKCPVPVWKLGGSLGLMMHSHPAFQAAAASHPPALLAQHCSPAVGLRAPSTGTDLPKAEHHSPLSPPHGRNPQHWRWATVSYALHFTHTALCSHQCQVHLKEVKASFRFFVCLFVFIRSPLFFQPPIFLLGPSP